MRSVWSETGKLPAFERLEKNINTDVLVIGGGMAGLLCAYELKQAGVDCVLVEAETLCSGATKNTTAKITAQHGLICHKLIRQFGAEKARRYLDANQEALKRYDALCRHIDCDFERKDNYVYSIHDRDKIDRELAALRQLGLPARSARSLPLPVPTAGAVKLEGQAQFNPLKFAAAIAPGLTIYEHTAVRELAPGRAAAERGSITAKKIVAATHFPFLNKHGSYFLKLYQSRSYVLGLENAPDVDGMYVDEEEKGKSFRSYKNLLLLGGGGHRTGKRGGGWEELECFAAKHYPDARIKYRWAAQDCMSLDGVPYIGQYSAHTPDLYVAAGFNKWGMTSAMVSAKLLSDLITGKENPAAQVFSPSRTILRPQLARNAAQSAVNLLTPAAKRCPHMGCALKWNKAEHSWDCPCHGSRFTAEGKLLDNPATGGLKK